MRSIQEVGLEILGNSPKPFYIFCGPEYGLKEKYIKHLESLYGSLVSSSSVTSVLKSMETKQLIPRKPAVYVVRYDEQFVKSVDVDTSSLIKNTHIIGTIICIYDDDKTETKLDKYLDDYCTRLDCVSSSLIYKYLKSDYTLPENTLQTIAAHTTSYKRADTLCKLLVNSSFSKQMLAESDIDKLLNIDDSLSDVSIKKLIASKNFKKLSEFLDNSSNLDNFIYTVFSTMLELERGITNKYVEISVREYCKYWTLEDTYNMFMSSYDQLSKLRSISSYSVKNACIYLIALLQFQQIPSVEVLS